MLATSLHIHNVRPSRNFPSLSLANDVPACIITLRAYKLLGVITTIAPPNTVLAGVDSDAMWDMLDALFAPEATPTFKRDA